MSLPIQIRSTSSSTSSRSSVSELLRFPPTPPFVSERHACAFPSWPDRPNLRSEPSVQQSNPSGYFSELDLCGALNTSAHMQAFRRRRPSNYLELEFEDDSDDESVESSPNASPSNNPAAPSVRKNSISLLSDQLQREKLFRDKNRAKFLSAVAE